jgi:hypothetical protein
MKSCLNRALLGNTRKLNGYIFQTIWQTVYSDPTTTLQDDSCAVRGNPGFSRSEKPDLLSNGCCHPAAEEQYLRLLYPN